MRRGIHDRSNADVRPIPAWIARGFQWKVIAACASLLLGACTTTPEPPKPAPKVESLPELMHQAETAAAAGDKEKARSALRAAAKVDPVSKAPWLKLAETYFANDDYGNAILSAQEVLQRDASDSVAAGVLAVSGLRVSIQALGTLRQQNNIAAGTRSEAETLARSLRELLGEPVLVPRPVVEEPPPAPPPRRRKRAVVPADRPSAATKAAPPPKPAPPTNPFDKLK